MTQATLFHEIYAAVTEGSTETTGNDSSHPDRGGWKSDVWSLRREPVQSDREKPIATGGSVTIRVSRKSHQSSWLTRSRSQESSDFRPASAVR